MQCEQEMCLCLEYYVSRAIELLKELKDKIQHCNKIIWIADTSSTCWRTVNEYEMIGYASDYVDDKNIHQAEEKVIQCSKNWET